MFVLLTMNSVDAISHNKSNAEEVLALTKIASRSFEINFEYNCYGWITSETKIVMLQNELSYKYEYEYDKKGNLSLLKRFIRKANEWSFLHYEENSYNDDSQIITKKIYYDYGQGFRFERQLFYSYQDSFLETITAQTIINEENSRNDIQEVFLYNDNHQLIRVDFFAWINNQWVLIEVYDFDYNDFGNIINYTKKWVIDDSFLEEWRYSFIYDDDNELIDRSFLRWTGTDWSSRPQNKYLYELEAMGDDTRVLYPNIYQFDFLDFNWFYTEKKMIKDEFWATDCGGTIHFEEAAHYYYQLIIIEEFEEEEEIKISNFNIEPFSIYPNPTTGELRILWTSGQVDKIEVYDILGRKQKAESRKGKFPSNELEGWTRSERGGKDEVALNISHLPNGLYFITITTENGISTKKIIKH